MSLAKALSYCHKDAIAGNMILHRDLKPDNIGFTLDGTLKIMDFGLAEIVENASPFSNEVYQMSGETGSLRYMAPEVAEGKPYNHKADVYSFGTSHTININPIPHSLIFSFRNRNHFMGITSLQKTV